MKDLEALGRSLGGFSDLGGFLEALGGSLDRLLEALGRMTESGYQRKRAARSCIDLRSNLIRTK